MNKFKKAATLSILGVGLLVLPLTLGISNDSFIKTLGQEQPATTIIFNESVTTSTSFVSQTKKSSVNENFELKFTHVKAASEGIGTIKAHSYVERTAPSYGLKTIKVDFDGNASSGLTILTYYNSTDKVKRRYSGVRKPKYNGITSGTTYNVEGNYFQLFAGASDVTIKSITVEFGCRAETKVDRPATSKPTNITFTNAYNLQDTATNSHFLEIEGDVTFGTNKYISENMSIFDNGEDLVIKDVHLSDESLYSASTTVRILIRVDIRASKGTTTKHQSDKAIFWSHLWMDGGTFDGSESGDIKLSYMWSHNYKAGGDTTGRVATANSGTEAEVAWYAPGNSDDLFYRVCTLWKMPCLRINVDW